MREFYGPNWLLMLVYNAARVAELLEAY